ncbi:MAG: T9SS type A sorting domain-containing protein [Ignavibacteria bacterium]|nr:T9SS type A sorting domain-containing protein [Ignavibacteria bacterium]
MPVKGYTVIEIFNSVGQIIIIPVKSVLEAGSYSIRINFAAYSSGIYFCRFRSGQFTKSLKMLYIK